MGLLIPMTFFYLFHFFLEEFYLFHMKRYMIGGWHLISINIIDMIFKDGVQY